MLGRTVQPSNALSPILVTLEGRLMVNRLVQPENAARPILVTLEGIVTMTRLVQFRNAQSPILVTVLGIVTVITEVLLVPKTVVLVVLPTFFTGSPTNWLGIVTAPVAVEAVIVAPPFSTI